MKKNVKSTINEEDNKDILHTLNSKEELEKQSGWPKY